MQKQVLSVLLLFLPISLLAQETGTFLPEQFIREADTLNYRILYPEGFSEEKEYPLVLFLHGAGERGNDNTAQLIHGSKLFLENKEFPAVVLFPQCPAGEWWATMKVDQNAKEKGWIFTPNEEPTEPLSLVLGLLDETLAKDFVKKDQVYLGGLSMGGMGSFELLARRPNTFAAALPICGGGNPESVGEYAKNTDLWIFHGAKDNVVPQELSIAMAKAINEAGGTANLTIYGDANHNSWDPAFAEPNLLKWLFSQTLEPVEPLTAQEEKQ